MSSSTTPASAYRTRGMRYTVTFCTSPASTNNSGLLGPAEGGSGEEQLGIGIGENIQVFQGNDQGGTRGIPVGDPEDHTSLEKKKKTHPPTPRPGRGVGGRTSAAFLVVIPYMVSNGPLTFMTRGFFGILDHTLIMSLDNLSRKTIIQPFTALAGRIAQVMRMKAM